MLKYIKDNLKNNCEKGEAIQLAVRRCIDEDILKDFLKTHSSEVGSMLYDDISIEEFIELRAEERAQDLVETKIEEIAKKMKEKGTSTEEICEITGLTKEEVEQA